MRHLNKGKKLNRTSSHRKAMLGNMAVSLFRHETIQTTDAKAKAVRSVAEGLITLAKRGDLHARRQAYKTVRDQGILKKLFDEIGPRFMARAGGYTRVTKSGFRKGDCAPMAVIELVENSQSAPSAE